MKNNEKNVIIERAEIITPFGNKDETLNSLYAGKSAVVAEDYLGLPVSLAHIPENYPKTTKQIVEYYRNLSVGAHCIRPNMQMPREQMPSEQQGVCNTPLQQYNSPKTLFIYSIAKGDINGIIDKSYTAYSPIPEEQAKQIAAELGLGASKIMVSGNACAAGAAAIDTARLFLTNGTFETVVIFGLEQISEFTVSGFHALSAISPSGARPFDKNRNGMSLGEGSGICVLKYATPQKNDICVLGSGASNDANHRTGPSKTGDGLALAIERALKSANIHATEISAIKCHGTATPYNDAMEAKALKLIFGKKIPPMVSLKGAIGHLSGAGSMIETVISAEFLKYGKIPPTIGFEEFEGEEQISVSSIGRGEETFAPIQDNTILCLSAGFGGINTAVILRKIPYFSAGKFV